ncbi:MAG: hypothetical protein FJW31_25310 [Acidobacteria bacterium]|nr:hypothetical protein [Acidobacteriota bacterium]
MSSSGRPGAVFLGGACGATNWRKEIATPLLDQAGVSYDHPQVGVGEWTELHEMADQHAKTAAEVPLFVINEATRGVASVAEVAYVIASGRPLALCLRMLPGDAPEIQDLNRGRIFCAAWLSNMAYRSLLTKPRPRGTPSLWCKGVSVR